MWYSFLFSSTFYLILLGLALFGYGLIQSSPLKKLPVFNNKKSLMIAAAIGFIVTSGIFAGLGFDAGSIASTTSAGVVITDLQITTTFNSTVNGTTGQSENPNTDDLLDLRYYDDEVSETATQLELEKGIITVTRGGVLNAASCEVRAIVPTDYQDQSAPNGNTFNIVEKTSLGVPEVYLKTGGASSTSAPKETTQLAFAEGVATATLGVAVEVDEEGHDALDQYSYKDVIVDVCGMPFTVRVHKMDA